MAAKHADDSPRSLSLIGCVLDGRYRIDGLLGEGGLGQVFRAVDRRLARPVAIKVMHAHLVAKDDLRARFEREARSLAALSHPNVVGVVDYGVDGDVPFLVMELLEGRTLENALADGLEPSRMLPILRDVLRAVAYAHTQGVVHRDLKPANVFLQAVPAVGEVVRVLDFGLAKFVEDDVAAPTLTRAGAVLGTPAYMSPEQATGGEVDARADVYALGIVLFEMATGVRPFQAPSGPELVRQHLLVELPSMLGKRTDLVIRPELDALARRAAAKSRVDRFADGGEMAAALDALPSDSLRSLGEGVRVTSAPRPVAPELDRTVASSPEAIGATMASSPNDPPIPTIPMMASPVVPVGSQVRAAVQAHGVPQQALAPRSSSIAKWARRIVPLVLVLALIGVWAVTRSSDPPPTPLPPVLPPIAITPPVDPTPAVPAVASPAPNQAAPFDAPLPSQLTSIETRVRAGREITAEQRRTLFRYAGNHPHDPRAWLLMGHADFSVGARTDACGRYERAFRADESAREDPTMRHDLLVMAGHRAVAGEASRLIQLVYGPSALPHIAAIETELAGDRDAVRRLRSLRRRLESPD